MLFRSRGGSRTKAGEGGGGIEREVEVTDQGRRGRWWNREGSGGHGPRQEMGEP